MRDMETASSTPSPATSATPVTSPVTSRRSAVPRTVPVPIASSSAAFDTALAAHRMASRALADTAVQYLAERITKTAGDVEFTVELTPAGTCRLRCDALSEPSVGALQLTVLDQLSWAALTTTGHTPARSHAAAMTWHSGRVRTTAVR